MLDGVCRCDTNGSPTFIEADAPTDDTLQKVLFMILGEQARACRHAIGHKVRGLVSESYVTAAPQVKAALAEELGTLCWMPAELEAPPRQQQIGLA